MMPYFCRFHPGQVEVAPALLMLAREGARGLSFSTGGQLASASMLYECPPPP